jgi:hypothetical protein
MDDRMLHEYRREPDPAFARDLRERLRRHEKPRRFFAAPAGRLIAAAAAVVVVAGIFSIPSVRVSAQSVLDIFRVKRFAAVEFRESRRETLVAMEKDRLMVFDKEETLVDPGPAKYAASKEEAGTQAGFPVLAPRYLPEGVKADSVFVQGEGAIRFSVSEPKLRSLLDKLDLSDVTIPAGMDGQWVEIRKPPMVMQRFRGEKRRAMLIQAPSPEISMPAGWDLERLGEIGLRILGLDAGEARRIAKATDWKSTLLVPLPMDATTFRQVTVGGNQGLMITTKGEKAADGKSHREGTLLMWSEGGKVFCLTSDLRAEQVMQIAESVS